VRTRSSSLSLSRARTELPEELKRHITTPPITHLDGQDESEDEKVLKGPKVIQLLRMIVEMRKEHKKLNDQLVEYTLLK